MNDGSSGNSSGTAAEAVGARRSGGRQFDLSIIVVAWNVEPYIGEAVQSCFACGVENCEIIVVENHSSDGTLAAIEEATAGRENAVVVRNPSNIGLGPARNQGVALARGAYFVFLDGDDFLAESTMKLIVEEVHAANADVGVFDHMRMMPDSRILVNRDSKRLKGGLCNTYESRSHLATTFQCAWNKIYKTEFVRRCGFEFKDSFHEDIDWTFPILMTAPSAVAIDHMGIVYRVRAGSILTTKSSRHFEVCDRVAAVVDFLDRNANSLDERWRRFYASRVLWQFDVMVKAKQRLNWDEKLRMAGRFGEAMEHLAPSPAVVARRVPKKILEYLLRKGFRRMAVAAVLIADRFQA